MGLDGSAASRRALLSFAAALPALPLSDWRGPLALSDVGLSCLGFFAL
jgi:hypothetical protein